MQINHPENMDINFKIHKSRKENYKNKIKGIIKKNDSMRKLKTGLKHISRLK